MRMKKYAAALLTATTVIGSLAACGKDKPAKNDPTPAPATPAANTPAPDGPTAPVATPFPDRDLKGQAFIIGDHWSPETPAAPANTTQEEQQAYREANFKKYNFRMQSKSVSSWDDMTNTCVDTIVAGTPAADMFELDYRFVAKPMSQGLFYDLATLKELDFSEEKFLPAVTNLMKKGNAIYGMRTQVSEPRGGVIFNKALFKAAGLSPDLPYDMQKKGEWTWNNFKDLCAKLTRDTNNDGVTDVYATVSQGGETLQCLVASTGEDFFAKDANGDLINNCRSQKVVDAMNFAQELYNLGYECPQPADSNWDYFFNLFQTGKAAMTFGQEYMLQPVGQPYGQEGMPGEDIGFVLPPKPDGHAQYYSYVCDNITIIPSCFDAAKASDIAFAYNVYTAPVPGQDDPDAWLDQYKNHFNDKRAVEETLPYFNDGKSTQFLVSTLIAGLNVGDLVWQYPFAGKKPSDVVDTIWDNWQAQIDAANGKQ